MADLQVCGHGSDWQGNLLLVRIHAEPDKPGMEQHSRRGVWPCAPARGRCTCKLARCLQHLVLFSSRRLASFDSRLPPPAFLLQAPSEVKGKPVDDIINEWNAELERRSRSFVKHAEALAQVSRRSAAGR